MSSAAQKVSDKKVINSPNSSSSPLSASEFNKVMSSIKNAQDETLSHCKALLSSQNK